MRTSSPSGFTLIELVFFVVNVSLGVMVAKRAFQHFGWLGGVVGFIGGFAIIPAVVMFPAWLFGRRKHPKTHKSGGDL